jgi:heme-degrading monooxygenase HmoA
MISKTLEPPYYAVIFTSIRTEVDKDYAATSEKMIELAEKQAGFLGVEHARNMGRSEWYKEFKVRIARVERDYGFG